MWEGKFILLWWQWSYSILLHEFFFKFLVCYTAVVKYHTESKVKVKCPLVQALRLCIGHTAHRWSRGIALLFYDHGTRRGWGVRITPRPLFNPGQDPVPIVQGAGWAPAAVWTGAENLAPTGIRSPDRPARSHVTILTELPGPRLTETVHIYAHYIVTNKRLVMKNWRIIRHRVPLLRCNSQGAQAPCSAQYPCSRPKLLIYVEVKFKVAHLYKEAFYFHPIVTSGK